MKTKLIIEIETPDAKDVDIFPLDDPEFKEITKKEYKENWCNGIHKSIVNGIKKYLEKDGDFEENFFDDMEEDYIEGWDDFEDYKIKITVKKDE